MGLRGMFCSTLAVVVGAILYWALTAHSSSVGHAHGIRLSQVGIILMIAGGAGFLTSAVIFGISRTTPDRSTRTMDSQTIDSQGLSTIVHEEQH
jgi:hypothetical protein